MHGVRHSGGSSKLAQASARVLAAHSCPLSLLQPHSTVQEFHEHGKALSIVLRQVATGLLFDTPLTERADQSNTSELSD